MLWDGSAIRFLTITLASTSVGLVVPILADAGLSETVLGQLIIAGATAGEFGAITLLTLFFSETKGGTASDIVTFGIFGVVVAAVGVTLGRAGSLVSGVGVFGFALPSPKVRPSKTRTSTAPTSLA